MLFRSQETCALLADGVAYFDELRASEQGAIFEAEVKERNDGLAQCKARLAKLTTR